MLPLTYKALFFKGFEIFSGNILGNIRGNILKLKKIECSRSLVT